jgi:hypothetical protein
MDKVLGVNMSITHTKKTREALDRQALARNLLRLEPLGVLSREICYQSIPTDEEDPGLFGANGTKSWGVLPPRLFFIPKYFTLVHCYGDDAFYEKHPEYEKGGLSKECYVVEDFPRYLANYFAMESTYQRVGLVPKVIDPLSLEARRPPPVTQKEHNAARKHAKELIKQRVDEYEKLRKSRIRLVEEGGDDGQIA